jgi:hypothetical protein
MSRSYIPPLPQSATMACSGTALLFLQDYTRLSHEGTLYYEVIKSQEHRCMRRHVFMKIQFTV